MATVYLAIQENFEREVALKVMSPALSENKDFSERFLREARIVSRLVHPHIVTVHDVGIQNGHHYLSMEYIEGEELKERLPSLNGEQLIRVVSEVAKALDYAGRKGYVHRDVKPENIMIHNQDGRSVLMDFGSNLSNQSNCHWRL
jgi:serine/threonine protein kinase